jgi:hypothetical protein
MSRLPSVQTIAVHDLKTFDAMLRTAALKLEQHWEAEEMETQKGMLVLRRKKR